MSAEQSNANLVTVGWEWSQMNDKVRRRILQSGVGAMLVEVHFDAGAVTPVHTHPHEQITYVVSGELILTIAGVEKVVKAGESVLLLGNVPHGARSDVPTVLLDTFTPPREEFLATDRRVLASVAK